MRDGIFRGGVECPGRGQMSEGEQNVLHRAFVQRRGGLLNGHKSTVSARVAAASSIVVKEPTMMERSQPSTRVPINGIHAARRSVGGDSDWPAAVSLSGRQSPRQVHGRGVDALVVSLSTPHLRSPI